MSKARIFKSGQVVIGETIYTFEVTLQDGIYSLTVWWQKSKKDRKEIHASDIYFKPVSNQIKKGVKLMAQIHNEAVVQKIDPEKEPEGSKKK